MATMFYSKDVNSVGVDTLAEVGIHMKPMNYRFHYLYSWDTDMYPSAREVKKVLQDRFNIPVLSVNEDKYNYPVVLSY